MRRIRLSFNRTPNPHSSTPQLLETASRSVTPRSMELGDEHAGNAAQAETTHGQR